MKKSILNVFLMLFVLLFSACTAKNEVDQNEKKQLILNMKDKVLQDLYILKPDVKAQITNAEGYGVFTNANLKIIFASVGGGYGVIKNNNTQRYTYMRMGEAGVGLGLGIKDYRLILVFHTKESLNNFIKNGWTLGAQADVSAKANNQGYSVGGEMNVNDITIYELTENGLSLQGTIKATKFWKDEELN